MSLVRSPTIEPSYRILVRDNNWLIVLSFESEGIFAESDIVYLTAYQIYAWQHKINSEAKTNSKGRSARKSDFPNYSSTSKFFLSMLILIVKLKYCPHCGTQLTIGTAETRKRTYFGRHQIQTTRVSSTGMKEKTNLTPSNPFIHLVSNLKKWLRKS